MEHCRRVSPPAIPDANGNKLVDASEFAPVIASAQGSLSGGIAYGLPAGGAYSDPGLPTSSNGAATALLNGSYSGNVMLIGTPANPIELNGKIAVAGDVIIKGPIKGTGQIFAQRNIYFIGDTTYADAASSYGAASDGTKNLVAYAAGGNMLIGDYLTPKGITTQVWDPKKGKFKTKTVDFDVTTPEYLTTEGLDSGGPPNSGVSASFPMSEVTLFNKMEYAKAQADPSYVPRYYRQRPTDPVYRYTGPKEHGSKYDADFTAFTPQAGAAILDLSPAGDWVAELFLKQVWRTDEESRPSSGAPFRIDGLLYTNNSIFALARSMSKHNSRTLGQILLRGGLIAADLGILSPGEKNTTIRGFTLHYDQRVRNFLNIQDVANLGFTRLLRTFDS